MKCTKRKRSLGSLTTKSQGVSPQPSTTAEDYSSNQRRTNQLLSPSSSMNKSHGHQGLFGRPSYRKLRRNSFAVIRCSSPIELKSRSQEAGSFERSIRPSSPSLCLGCTGGLQDPELAEMDRKSNISWSATVGSSDSRSVDTGLNELCRITGMYLMHAHTYVHTYIHSFIHAHTHIYNLT